MKSWLLICQFSYRQPSPSVSKLQENFTRDHYLFLTGWLECWKTLIKLHQTAFSVSRQHYNRLYTGWLFRLIHQIIAVGKNVTILIFSNDPRTLISTATLLTHHSFIQKVSFRHRCNNCKFGLPALWSTLPFSASQSRSNGHSQINTSDASYSNLIHSFKSDRFLTLIWHIYGH